MFKPITFNLFTGLGGFNLEAENLVLLGKIVIDEDVDQVIHKKPKRAEKPLVSGEKTHEEEYYYKQQEERGLYANQEEELGYCSSNDNEIDDRYFNSYYKDRGIGCRQRKVPTRMFDVVYGGLVARGGKKNTQATGGFCRKKGKTRERDGSDNCNHKQQCAAEQPYDYYNYQCSWRLCS